MKKKKKKKNDISLKFERSNFGKPGFFSAGVRLVSK